MLLNLKNFIYQKTPRFVKQLIPKFIKKKLRKKFFPYYFLMSDLKQLPCFNYINNNCYEMQKELVYKFKIHQKQNSFMTSPYLHELLLMRYQFSKSLNFLDIGGEYIDFFLQLNKNFSNLKYYIFNIEKINNNFEKVKKEYSFKNLIVIKDLNSIFNNKYDFINIGSAIQYFNNYEIVLKNITKISNNIFFSGTVLFESNKEDYKKHIITEQINCFPDKNYCYFFNKKYFYDFFYKQDFSLLFSKKNLTDNVNFKNFKNVFEKIEYEDFFFYKKPPEISY